jgi:hypothetical protein
MNFAFREIPEVTEKRFDICPLAKMTDGKTFDKPMEEYDRPLPQYANDARGEKADDNGIDVQTTLGGDNSLNELPNEVEEVYVYDDKGSVVKKQEDAIQDALDAGVDDLSPIEKGNFGEMCTDKDLREKGYDRISQDTVTDISESTHTGIDGVYENPDGDPRYIIVDSKYGTSQLQDTQDGKQLSETWINERLDRAVGREKADEIRLEQASNPENVEVAIAHVDENGSVSYEGVDGNGNPIQGKDVFHND